MTLTKVDGCITDICCKQNLFLELELGRTTFSFLTSPSVSPVRILGR